MSTPVTMQDAAFLVLWFVGYALIGSLYGYWAHQCARDPDRIRRRSARYYLDMHLSDVFIRERLLPRYRRLAIVLITLAITGPLGFLNLPLWWVPLLFGIVFFIGFELENR